MVQYLLPELLVLVKGLLNQDLLKVHALDVLHEVVLLHQDFELLDLHEEIFFLFLLLLVFFFFWYFGMS